MGAGFVLGPDTVLTCAHVVNAALGRDMLEPGSPGGADLAVQIHHGAGSRRCDARVAHWIPPRDRDGGPVSPRAVEWLGDLAVLRVAAPPDEPLQAPPRASMAFGQNVRAWHGGGRAATFADLRVTSLHRSLGYLDGAATGMAVGPGYSGGPLWCRSERAVVGLVVAAILPSREPHSPQHMIRRSWSVPWQWIEAELDRLGAPVPRSGTSGDPAFLTLTGVVANAFPSPMSRADAGRWLASACDIGYRSEVTPPTPEDFAAFALTHPRALAALSGLLRRTHPEAADEVLAAGGLSETPRLLTPAEHDELHRVLRSAGPAVLSRFPEAIRAALPHLAALPEGDSPDVLLDRLEELPGDGHSISEERRVPALLRVLEFLGRLCARPQQSELRLWADSVARRLGVSRGALGERRADAQAWARSLRDRSARVRVVVEVRRAQEGRHQLRMWCDEGAGLRQVTAHSAPSYTASEAAREVLRVLDGLTPPAGDERPPLVEVLVDRRSLNLPVDEWEARDPDDFVPGSLGVEYPLVVHCPELVRRHGRFISHWRSRWNRLDSGKTLVVSGSVDRDAIYSQLVNQLDTVRVCVDVPPGPRDAIVQTCLVLGIPVVVWDRGMDGASHVVEHISDVATRELPDGVRHYRAQARASPPQFPGHPVLAWADADRAVPRLHLTEPQENA
ncbi:hypothetical protein SRB5_07260 [Streptomyces sp. RB5]|uniref:Serine protease n=1 Tax=Streptomyces smaragdinus TaxID=2585196 RepID=A0A7K0CB01_9ACTN|nr:hypothetical protein [Streptomyces smaragdinus]